MDKIPIVTQSAIEEAFKSIAKIQLNNMDEEEIKEHLNKFSEEFSERQPELFEFTQQMMQGHNKVTEGRLVTAQLAIYITVIIKSIYIQKEMDEVTDLFNFDKEDDAEDL